MDVDAELVRSDVKLPKWKKPTKSVPRGAELISEFNTPAHWVASG